MSTSHLTTESLRFEIYAPPSKRSKSTNSDHGKEDSKHDAIQAPNKKAPARKAAPKKFEYGSSDDSDSKVEIVPPPPARVSRVRAAHLDYDGIYTCPGCRESFEFVDNHHALFEE